MKTNWLQFCKKHALAIALVVGFIFDNFTLRRSDRLAENLVLLAYLVLVAICIFLVNRRESNAKLQFWAGAAMQFSLGNLFSAFLVFFSRSSALSASWPFLLMLVGVMIGNEVFKKHYERIAFQVGVFYFALFSFLTFFLPVIFKNLSAWIFILSGVVSLLVIAGLVHGLLRVFGDRVKQSRQSIYLGVGGIYLAINILYFTNLIPPIPLAIKEAGIYHSVSRSGGSYQVLAEKESWIDYLWPGETLHVVSGQPLYLFSAIFSPSELDTNIINEWQYYNNNARSWETVSRVSIPIIGGREGGYRLYSYQVVYPGLWRVDVETSRGQVIGREKFKVKGATHAPQLYQEQL